MNTAPTQDLKPEQALALRLLAHRFPRVPIWFGDHTGHWWALARHGFVEADNPEELGRLLDRLQAPQPRPVDDRTALRTALSPGAGPYGPPVDLDMAERETAPIPAVCGPARAAVAPPQSCQRVMATRRQALHRRNIGSWMVPALSW